MPPRKIKSINTALRFGLLFLFINAAAPANKKLTNIIAIPGRIILAANIPKKKENAKPAITPRPLQNFVDLYNFYQNFEYPSAGLHFSLFNTIKIK